MPALNTNQLKTLKRVLPPDLYKRLQENKVKYSAVPFNASGTRVPVTGAEYAEILQALQGQRDALLADPPKGELTLAALNRKLRTLGVVVKPSMEGKGLIFGGIPRVEKNVSDKSYAEWVNEAYEGVAGALTFGPDADPDADPDAEMEQDVLDEMKDAVEAEEELLITEEDKQNLAEKANEAGLDAEAVVQATMDFAEDSFVEEEPSGVAGVEETIAKSNEKAADAAAERLRTRRKQCE